MSSTGTIDLAALSDTDLCDLYELAGDEVLRRRGYEPGPVTCIDASGNGTPHSRARALAIALRELRAPSTEAA